MDKIWCQVHSLTSLLNCGAQRLRIDLSKGSTRLCAFLYPKTEAEPTSETQH
jgi:hypothetical protein